MLKSSKSQPDLRFPEFELDWEEIRVGRHIDEFRGKSSDRNEYPVLTSSNRGLMKQEEYYGQNRITEKDNTGFNIIPPGYITYRSRSDNRTFTFNINDLGITGVISTYYPVFSIKNGSNRFFVEYFNYQQHYLGKYSVGTSQQVLSLNELREIKLRIPDQAEQQKIAAFLSAVDEKIRQLTRKKGLFLKYKNGVMQQIFDQETRFKDDNGTGFPDWEDTKLRQIGSFRSGVGFGEAAQGGSVGIPFYKVSDMNLAGNEFYMTKANNYVTPEQIRANRYNPIHEPSILFAKVGAAIFLERKRIAQDFLIDNNMMAFTPKGKVLFIKYLFDMIRLSRFAQVGALPSYNSSDIGIIKIWVPSPEEQTKIVDFLSVIDEKLNSVQKQLEIARGFKKGLLQQMFL